MIAHRLSTVKDVDKIAVMENGQIVDLGTFDELLARCTLFKDMWQEYSCSIGWTLGKEESLVA